MLARNNYFDTISGSRWRKIQPELISLVYYSDKYLNINVLDFNQHRLEIYNLKFPNI